MKEIFRFFHKCFFALQKFKSFFILSIFFDKGKNNEPE